MFFVVNIIFWHEIGQIQWIFYQHCGYCWLMQWSYAFLALTHQYMTQWCHLYYSWHRNTCLCICGNHPSLWQCFVCRCPTRCHAVCLCSPSVAGVVVPQSRESYLPPSAMAGSPAAPQLPQATPNMATTWLRHHDSQCCVQIQIYWCFIYKGLGLLSYPRIKLWLTYHDFFNVASDWLAALLAANQRLHLKIMVLLCNRYLDVLTTLLEGLFCYKSYCLEPVPS